MGFHRNLLYLTSGLLLLLAKSAGRREGKLLSLFNVVRFRNEPCNTSGLDRLEGTCTTMGDCVAQGGVAAGNCAAGFGSCCVFTQVGCGGTISRNCTYVRNLGFPAATTAAGTCKYTAEKVHPDICFVRLDFKTYKDAGPLGVGQCTQDSLTFVQGDGVPTPTLCGTLTGQHIYLESGRGGMASMFTAMFTNTATATSRNYDIKVSQIGCDERYTPRSGCAQYVTGVSGVIESYNFEGGYHLGEQEYQTCVRQEAGYCGITYTPISFNIGPSDTAARTGTSGNQKCSTDFILIPGGHNGDNMCLNSAKQNAVKIKTQVINRYCGAFLNCITGAAFNSPITTTVRPFVIVFTSDNRDSTPFDEGFKLSYMQVPC